MSGGRKLTVRDKILVHLAPFSGFADEFECPEGMSQAGISLAIGKSRAHTTLELNRMKEADLVTERLAHVKGTKSKRKTYTLTPQATVNERQISGHIADLDIQWSGPGGSGKTDGLKAVEVLMKELPASRAMAFDIILSSDGKVDLEEMKSHLVSHPEPVETEPASSEPPDTLSHDSRTFDAIVLQANMFSKKGRYKEALAILEKAMEANASNSDLSKAHYSRASIFRKQGNYPSALEEINKSLKIAEDTEKPLMVGRCQMEKAMILSGTGNESKPLDLLDSAEMVFRRENSQVDLLRCGINQAIILRNMGKINEAVDVLDISLDLAERTSLDRLKAYALVNLTDLLNEQKEYDRSRKLASQARDVFQVLDEPLMFAAALFNLGTALVALGEKEEAVTSFDNAISILEKNEMLTSRTSWLEKYASILEELGETEKAKSILNKI
jgi:tetratricopeptide (TPR) repeat protein